MTLRELAERLRCRLEGDGSLDIARVSGIEHAGPGDLSFIANPKYLPFLQTTRASAVLVTPDVDAPAGGPARLVCDRPYLAFAQALGILVNASLPEAGIDPSRLDRLRTQKFPDHRSETVVVEGDEFADFYRCRAIGCGRKEAQEGLGPADVSSQEHPDILCA